MSVSASFETEDRHENENERARYSLRIGTAYESDELNYRAVTRYRSKLMPEKNDVVSPHQQHEWTRFESSSAEGSYARAALASGTMSMVDRMPGGELASTGIA